MIPGTGNRVLSAVRQAADGSCTGAAISFCAGVNYTLTTNDFTAGGGDGYPNNRSRMTTQDILDQDLADYLAAVPGGVISPVIQHRIHCTDSTNWPAGARRHAFDRQKRDAFASARRARHRTQSAQRPARRGGSRNRRARR